MKKTLGSLVVAAAVVLMTATFGFAEFAAGGADEFPYFQLGGLIIGGLGGMAIMSCLAMAGRDDE